MKKRKWLFLALLSLFILAIPSQTLAADDPTATLNDVNQANAEKTAKDPNNVTQPKDVKKAGVSLHIKRFPLSRYQANNEAADSKIKGAFLGLANVFASLSQMVVNIVDTGMDVLYNLKPIDTFADKLTMISTKMYQTLKANFGQLLFILGMGYIAYLFFVKQSAKEAIKRFFMMLLVIGIGGWWMLNAGYMMQTMNSLSIEAQGKLMSVGNTIVHVFGGSGNYADTSKIQSGNEVEGTVAIMRNVYFDMALKKPFLIANFGATDEAKINSVVKDKKGLSRVDTLLSYKLTSDGEKAKSTYIEKEEIKNYHNEEMADGNVYTQFGVNFVGFIGAIALGIPFLMMAFFSFLLQFLALGIAFLLPIMFFMAWLPWMANSGYVGLKRLISVFVVKAILGLLVVLVYLMCFIVDTMIPPLGFGMYALNLIVTAGLLILLYIKRDKAISFVTAGKVKSVDNKMIERVRQEVVQPSWEAAKKTGHVAGATMNATMIQPSRWIASKISGRKEAPTSPDTPPEDRTPQKQTTPAKEEPVAEIRTPQTQTPAVRTSNGTKISVVHEGEPKDGAPATTATAPQLRTTGSDKKPIPTDSKIDNVTASSVERTPQRKAPEAGTAPRVEQPTRTVQKVVPKRVVPEAPTQEKTPISIEPREAKRTGTDMERMHLAPEKRDG
ncbi:CD3337/EF1877 family mobilome membrane protein [Listeria rustica]|uniref:Conjugal transfer protein n=1 Tax=Listeria rustica TaxID=2713503 RepID=A0A7W1T4W1_9LIST|nr:hypothetical protein [Listeria rustica]MBA3925571.1 hypothetical protein [Listeria rustica]